MIGEALYVIRHWIELTLEPARSTSEQVTKLHHAHFAIRQLDRLGFAYQMTPGNTPTNPVHSLQPIDDMRLPMCAALITIAQFLRGLGRVELVAMIRGTPIYAAVRNVQCFDWFQ